MNVSSSRGTQSAVVACLRRVPRWTRRQTRQTRSLPSSRRCLRCRRSPGSFLWTPPRSSPRTRGRARRCPRPGTPRCPRPCLRRSAIWSWRWAAAATRAPRPRRPRRWRWRSPATAPTCARSSPRSRSLKVSQQVASCQAVDISDIEPRNGEDLSTSSRLVASN